MVIIIIGSEFFPIESSVSLICKQILSHLKKLAISTGMSSAKATWTALAIFKIDWSPLMTAIAFRCPKGSSYGYPGYRNPKKLAMKSTTTITPMM